MKAYPYDVELRLDNPNTKEATVTTRRVYAYNVIDAMTQAVVEASADAGSADVKVLRVAPPIECCAMDMLSALSDALRQATNTAPAVQRDVR